VGVTVSGDTTEEAGGGVGGNISGSTTEEAGGGMGGTVEEAAAGAGGSVGGTGVGSDALFFIKVCLGPHDLGKSIVVISPNRSPTSLWVVG